MVILSSLKQRVQKLLNAKHASHNTSATTPYERLGGEAGVRALADTFYDIMETAPEAKELLAIHPKPLSGIRQRFYEYLSGWLGGPPLFEQQYGHPRLRARHLPYPVTPALRDQWMFCMNSAVQRTVSDPRLQKSLLSAFSDLATHMINRQDHQQT